MIDVLNFFNEKEKNEISDYLIKNYNIDFSNRGKLDLYLFDEIGQTSTLINDAKNGDLMAFNTLFICLSGVVKRVFYSMAADLGHLYKRFEVGPSSVENTFVEDSYTMLKAVLGNFKNNSNPAATLVKLYEIYLRRTLYRNLTKEFNNGGLTHVGLDDKIQCVGVTALDNWADPSENPAKEVIQNDDLKDYAEKWNALCQDPSFKRNDYTEARLFASCIRWIVLQKGELYNSDIDRKIEKANVPIKLDNGQVVPHLTTRAVYYLADKKNANTIPLVCKRNNFDVEKFIDFLKLSISKDPSNAESIVDVILKSGYGGEKDYLFERIYLHANSLRRLH